MAGLGRKEWSPGDTLNAADVNGYLMDQSVMVFAGTAARASAIPTPSAGMVAYSTATQLQVYDGSAWVDLSTGYGVATGGSATSVTVGGTAYTLLTFTSDSTLTVTKAGLFDVLAFGGGGGGQAYSNGGGGGGAGGIIQQTIYLSGNQTVTIGAGGAAGNQPGAPSSIGSIPTGITASGSAFGKNPAILIDISGGGVGGSSGGNAATGNNIQGFGGGASTSNDNGGGGGGAAGAGATGSGTTGGAGGVGYDVSAFIGGSSLFKGGGGGGGGLTAGGAGGSGVGGAGAGAGTGGTAAANTASGGGGRGSGAAAGAGGSGIIYVRFKV